MERESETSAGPQRVAVIIACQDVRKYISSTVRACRAIPSVDLIVVVDDGSTDDTSQVARAAGAVVVRHSVSRGRASALETGVKVAAMRDRTDWPARNLLFLSPDLGDSAVEANALVEAVNSGLADCAVGVVPVEDGTRRGATWVMAGNGIRQSTGWDVSGPLSLQRCLTREVINEVMPFSNGWGADVGMTIDLLIAGFSIVEIACAFHHLDEHRVEPNSHKRAQYWDIWWAIKARRLRRRRVPLVLRIPSWDQEVGRPYAIRGRTLSASRPDEGGDQPEEESTGA